MLTTAKKIRKALLEIIFPSYCLLCRNKIPLKKEKKLVCDKCFGKIVLNTPPFCQKCGRKIAKKVEEEDKICKHCHKQKYHFDRAWASCSYERGVKTLLHNFKYKDKLYLNVPLSRLMINFANEYSLPINRCDYIVAIPLSKTKLREREFNQAELLAENLSREIKRPYLNDNLWRKKNNISQTSLNRNARLNNLKNSFATKRPQKFKNKAILLIDDVLTSGATVSEAAKTLKAAGAGTVWVFTLAN